MGVGLGLAGYRPDELDHKQLHEAVRMSEEHEIEQTMFEDKLKTTDWEATNEAIEEQIARESYLQWCRESMQTVKKSETSATVTSTAVSGQSGGSSSSCSSSSFMNNTGSDKGDEFKLSPTAISGAISPGGRASPNVKPYQSDDNQKDSSTGSSGSSFYDQSSVSSHGSSDAKYLLNFTSRQRRRRRHRHAASSTSVEEDHQSTLVTLPVTSLEIKNLNMIETNSNDSGDLSDGMSSKKLRRRLNPKSCSPEHLPETEKKQVSTKPTPLEPLIGPVPEIVPPTCAEPGPSNRTSSEGEKSSTEETTPPISFFYHSLLESSYAEDGELKEIEAFKKKFNLEIQFQL